MDAREKKEFIQDLLRSIEKSLLEDVADGKIPDEWDGIELRRLIADRADASARYLTGRRLRDYRNTVLVNNL